MASLLLQPHSAGSSDNKDIVVRDHDKPPSIEHSLGIDAASSQPFSSQTIWYCGAPLKTMMDLDSGRCRRTDGKKWRCRRDVIPDQKYCDRHIHRGRQRSRKPVEVGQTISESKSTAINPNSIVKVNGNLPSSIKGNLGNYSDAQIKKERSFDVPCSNYRSFETKKRSRGDLNGPDCGDRVALEFGFSPKSVLQHVQGCGTSSNNHGTPLIVTESQRCRRTDGKKWRCSREVVPEQKYCDQHMHRGAKKVKIGQKSNTHLPFSVGTSYQQTGIVKNHNCDPNDVSSSSSSDATTISI